MKDIYKLMPISLAILVLNGCSATPATIQQHQYLARNLALLNTCINRGMINTDIASHGKALYQKSLQQYRFDDNLLNTYFQSFLQRSNSINQQHCNQQAVAINTEIIERNRRAEELNQAIQTFNHNLNSITESNRQLANTYSNMANGIQQYNNQMFQQNYSIYPNQSQTNCMRVANGMFSCTTRPR